MLFCHYPTCTSSAYYGRINTKVPIMCRRHKTSEYRKYIRCCEFGNCAAVSRYNSPGEKISLFCTEHKRDGDVIVKFAFCLDCDKSPSFNKPGKLNGLYCVTHKKEGMVNVLRGCAFPDCIMAATYCGLNEKTPIYCRTHKRPQDISHRRRYCKDCYKCATFGPPGKKPNYCFAHKKPGDINVTARRCNFEGCALTGSYVKIEKGSDAYCSAHRPEGYIRKRAIDKVLKTCETADYTGIPEDYTLEIPTLDM